MQQLSLPHQNPLRKGPPGPPDAVDLIDPRSRPHRMVDAWDIGEALSRLALDGDAVSIHAGAGGAPVLARVRSVDDEQEHFVLELADAVLPGDGALTCVAYLHGDKLQFTLDKAWRTAPDLPACIDAAFPPVCLVLERRSTERQQTPTGQPGQPGQPGQRYLATFVADGKPFELPIFDVSMGGIGLRAAPEVGESLYVGRKLQRVRLDFGVDLALVADLEIRLKRSFRTVLSERQIQVGLQFINLTGAQRDELRRVRLRLEQLRGG